METQRISGIGVVELAVILSSVFLFTVSIREAPKEGPTASLVSSTCNTFSSFQGTLVPSCPRV
jgi:hypothetical protein